MSKQPVSVLFEDYINSGRLAESSKAIKGRAVKYFVEFIGDKPVDEVSRQQAEEYRNKLSLTRSAAGVNTYLRSFKPFFKWLMWRGDIERNPFAELKLLAERRRKYFTYEAAEIERILRVSDPRWQAIILLALSSMRRGEILNLCVDDIYFDKSYVLISPKRETVKTWAWDIKNHNQEIVPMAQRFCLPDMVVSLPRLLKDLIVECRSPYVILPPKYYDWMTGLRAAGELTFEHRNCPWQNFSRDFRNLLKRAKVKPKRFHDLRRTFAISMAKNNVPLHDTQILMRHSSPVTTAKYYLEVEREELIGRANRITEKCYVSG